MESTSEGNHDGLQWHCNALVSACAQAGDLYRAMTMVDKMKAYGLSFDDSLLSDLFYDSEEEEVASPPPGQRIFLNRKSKGSRQFKEGKSGSTATSGCIGKFGSSKWQDLPLELLTKVLDHVDNRTVLIASGVCTGWRDSIKMGIMEISFTWCRRGVSRLVVSMAPKLTQLQIVSLRRCPYLTDGAIEALAASCPNLRCLDLTMATRITDQSLITIARFHIPLELLDLSGCLGIGEGGIVAVAAACSNLRVLNLCGCEGAATDAAIQAVSAGCQLLQSVNLGWCERLTDVGIQALAGGCTGLQVLDLCGCFQITDLSIISLADKCPGMKALGLHCCRNISNASMVALLQSVQRRTALPTSVSFEKAKDVLAENGAKTLSLEGNINYSTNDIRTASLRQCGRLLRGLHASSGNQNGLVSLNLSGCTSLKAPPVQALCNACPTLHTCPQRRSLNVSGCLGLTPVHCQCISNIAVDRPGTRPPSSFSSFDSQHRPL